MAMTTTIEMKTDTLRTVASGAHSAFIPQLPAEFEIKGPIGQGGMGVVLRARQKSLDRDVAIKVLPRQLSRNRKEAAALLNEARLCARLRHPNIVPVHQVALTRDDSVFVVMELLEGTTLQNHVSHTLAGVRTVTRRRMQSLLTFAFPVLFQLCDALEAAHAASVIHRDVKPANIQIDGEGRVRLMDFGIAILNEPSSAVAGCAGTLAYMAPEQYLSPETVDHRCDIYAVGGIIHFFLTGKPPRPDRTLTSIHTDGTFEPRTFEELASKGIPRSLLGIMTRALAANPEQRYSSIFELRSALEACYARTLTVRPHALWKPTLAAIFCTAAAIAALVYMPRHTGDGSRAAPAMTRAETLLHDIDRHLARPDLTPAQHGLLVGWRNELDTYLDRNNEARAVELGEYALTYIEREELRSLAQTLVSLSEKAGSSKPLHAAIRRYNGRVDRAITDTSVREDIRSLRSEGLALLVSVQNSL